MKKILERHWNVIIFTTVYLTLINDKETPNKYIYIVVLCVFILLIDLVIDNFKKKKK